MATEIVWDVGLRPEHSVRNLRRSNSPETSAVMRVNELVRKSVVFLGILDDTGAFVPYGTGFVVGFPEHGHVFSYLVTAAHVLEQMAASKRPPVCRINTVDGGATVAAFGLHDARLHPLNPKCDIAITQFNASRDTFDFRLNSLEKAVLTPEYVKKNDVGAGDEVFTVGLLVSHFGRNRNVPIIRAGVLSAMPEEHVDLGGKLGEQEVYLVESRSIGGLSGSPVFLQTPHFRIIDEPGDKSGFVTTAGHQREYLLGVHIGLFETKAHADKMPSDEATRREHFLESMSAGIGVVVPIQRAIEILETPEIKEHRRMAAEAANKASSFKPSSVAISDAAADGRPASEKNPNHREDFTSLLGAAARTRKSDGQT